MADPRDAIARNDVDLEFDFFQIDAVSITYSATAANGSAVAGVNLAVSLSSDNTVQLAGDGEAIIGRLEEVTADDYARVAVRGKKMLFKGGSGATLTLGAAIVGDLGAASAEGYIRESDGATAAEIQAQRGQILDNDATNPIIALP